MNKVFLTGHTGSDPKSGNGVSSVSLATSERWKDKNGEPQQRTEWHRIVFFGKLAEIADSYLAKGRQVLIEGRLHYDKYTDKDGIEKYSTDIIAEKLEFLGTRQGGQHDSAQRQATANDYRAAKGGQRPPPPQNDFDDDDIPF